MRTATATATASTSRRVPTAATAERHLTTRHVSLVRAIVGHGVFVDATGG
jgi:hypothetical protein